MVARLIVSIVGTWRGQTKFSNKRSRKVVRRTTQISSRHKHRSKPLMYRLNNLPMYRRSHKHLCSSQPQPQMQDSCPFDEATEIISETFNCEEI